MKYLTYVCHYDRNAGKYHANLSRPKKKNDIFHVPIKKLKHACKQPGFKSYLVF